MISSLFFLCLFRDMTMMKTLICCLVMAVRIRHIAHRSAIPACLQISPHRALSCPFPRAHHLSGLKAPCQAAAGAAMLLAFYSIALFLVTTEEKGRKAYKEIMGLSLLYGASSLNLFLTGHPELILPLSISVLLFLFIINRVTHYGLHRGIYRHGLIFFSLKGVPLLTAAMSCSRMRERYVLLACAFALLAYHLRGLFEEDRFHHGPCLFRPPLCLRRSPHVGRLQAQGHPPLPTRPRAPHRRAACGDGDERRERAPMKLLIAAGGTGGHIFPGISVAEAFMAKRQARSFLPGRPTG